MTLKWRTSVYQKTLEIKSERQLITLKEIFVICNAYIQQMMHIQGT